MVTLICERERESERRAYSQSKLLWLLFGRVAGGQAAIAFRACTHLFLKLIPLLKFLTLSAIVCHREYVNIIPSTSFSLF